MEALCAVFGVVGQRLEQFGIALFSHEGRGRSLDAGEKRRGVSEMHCFVARN
jgi:hypothetical protein